MALKKKREDGESEGLAKPAKLKKSKPKPEEAEAKKVPVPPFSVRAALALQLQAAKDALALADTGEAVHQTRIALKRLRVLARIAEQARPEGGAPLEYAARAIMKRLASARDLAAMEHAARAVAQKMDGHERAFLTRTVNEIGRTRPAVETFALSEAVDGVNRLAPILEAIPETHGKDGVHAARDLIRRARKAYKEARGSRSVLLRHAWRKREKDRRYGELMMGEAWPAKQHAKLEGKLTEALGRERDAGLLLSRLTANAHTPAAVIKQVKSYRRRLARRADKLGARLND